MKLRIRGNSVRIRVSQSELAQIAEQGFAEDAVEFSPGVKLSYRVEVTPAGPIRATYDERGVQIVLPSDAVQRWTEPNEVSIQSEQSLGDGKQLTILVEKDFACLSPREGEDEPIHFPILELSNDKNDPGSLGGSDARLVQHGASGLG